MLILMLQGKVNTGSFWLLTLFKSNGSRAKIIFVFIHITGFDQRVQSSKDQAEEALKKIPTIEDQIAAAEETTRDARDDLSDAERNAILARSIAEQAQEVGETASEVRRFSDFFILLFRFRFVHC